jgi:UDP-N-acetylmuramoylalanine--D-glutamate ligase
MQMRNNITEKNDKTPSDGGMAGKKILVVGLGISGLWSALCLAGKGAGVTVTEEREREDIDPEVLSILANSGVLVESGGHQLESFLHADMIVLSPGVPHDTPLIQSAATKGIPVIGEMELAARFIKIPIIAVTGTNGKSSVTTLIGNMLEKAGKQVFVGGNLGTPLAAYVARNEKADAIVAEASSFQLDTIVSFCPEVSIILNISPDHLDRYKEYEDYVRSKLRIFENQGSGHYTIVNDNDPVLHLTEAPSPVTMLRYGLEKMGGRHAFLDQNAIQAHLEGSKPCSFSLEHFSLPGAHNMENLMAVVLAGLALQVDPEIIQQTINEFKGLPHRLQMVEEIHGISFFNDSKATNIDAAIRAIRSFDRPIILIAGGRHKGADYDPLVEAAKPNVKHAIFMGESGDILANAFEGHIPFSLVEDMKSAVTKALSKAAKGDAILLAPACSSFDMYSSYGHRGKTFNNAVRDLAHG